MPGSTATLASSLAGYLLDPVPIRESSSQSWTIREELETVRFWGLPGSGCGATIVLSDRFSTWEDG